MSTMNITLPGLHWPYRAYAGELPELSPEGSGFLTQVRATFDLHPAAQGRRSF